MTILDTVVPLRVNSSVKTWRAERGEIKGIPQQVKNQKK